MNIKLTARRFARLSEAGVAVAMAASPAGKPPSPEPAAQVCKETSGLAPDVFGFAAGSDVAELETWSTGSEYGGAFGTRFGTSQAQVAGKANGRSSRLNLEQFNHHAIKANPGYAF